jgi:serine/threonine protein kinase
MSLADSPITLSGVLHQQVPTTHLPLTQALQLSLDVVRLVADAHDAGKVIGVLDAAHLTCTPEGFLKVGGSGGDYIAPELKRGEKPDRLTDVYALGALIYRLLSGRKVEPGKLTEPPSHFNPTVDTALDELVLEALDEDPSERPHSARALEQRLTRIFADLGLEPSEREEASALLRKSAAKYKSPLRFADAPKAADDDGDEVERPLGGVKGFLYDLGWAPGKPQRSSFHAAEVRSDDDEETVRYRNKLSQFFYDLGWFQSINWDAPETMTWVKRGGIAVGVLLLLVIAWPSHKKPRQTAAAAAIAEIAKQKAQKTTPAPTTTPTTTSPTSGSGSGSSSGTKAKLVIARH